MSMTGPTPSTGGRPCGSAASIRSRRSTSRSRWVADWTMVLALKEPGGAPFTARVEMLDVVTVNSRGEVTRKDVYVNGAQSQPAFARAGIKR